MVSEEAINLSGAWLLTLLIGDRAVQFSRFGVLKEIVNSSDSLSR